VQAPKFKVEFLEEASKFLDSLEENNILNLKT
jgi:hypothetical protein